MLHYSRTFQYFVGLFETISILDGITRDHFKIISDYASQFQDYLGLFNTFLVLLVILQLKNLEFARCFLSSSKLLVFEILCDVQ